MLTGAQALTNRFNALAKQLNDQNTTINGNLSDMASQVNKLATSIAHLNQKIAEISTSGGQPNDLLDTRNEAVRQLSELIGRAGRRARHQLRRVYRQRPAVGDRQHHQHPANRAEQD